MTFQARKSWQELAQKIGLARHTRTQFEDGEIPDPIFITLLLGFTACREGEIEKARVKRGFYEHMLHFLEGLELSIGLRESSFFMPPYSHKRNVKKMLSNLHNKHFVTKGRKVLFGIWTAICSERRTTNKMHDLQ